MESKATDSSEETSATAKGKEDEAMTSSTTTPATGDCNGG